LGEYGKALDADLNIAAALGHLFDTVRESNRAMDEGTLTSGKARALLDWWTGINSVLAFEKEVEAVPAEVLALVEKRKAARAAKDWALSDKLRDDIAALGWQVKDQREGLKLAKA